jgi:MoCo/4Fe-4S cofactor protein with predicted Tat translocation signal
MSSLEQRTKALGYWRSFDELSDTQEFRAFVQREFPYVASTADLSPSRRTLLKLMGASLALAGLTGCRWPKENIVEYARRPKGRVPGVPVQFATLRDLDGVATGVLVKSYDGRPIKVEGNPLHPGSLGSSDALLQAAILEMYDPDRSRTPLSAGPIKGDPWAVLTQALAATSTELKASKGKGLCILAEPSSSQTLAAAKAALLAAMPQAQWFEFAPLSRDNERVGTSMAFGQPMRPQWNLSVAKVVAAFDCDFLGTHPAAVRLMRDFARNRDAAAGKFCRLYAIESNMSLTGSNADERYAVKSGEILSLLTALAGELGVAGAPEAKAGGGAKFIADLAGDLKAAKGAALVMVGAQQPAAAHALVAAINATLESAGKTVAFIEDADAPRPAHLDALAALTEQLSAGSVDTLVILGGNPVLTAPADLKFADALKRAKTRIHLSLFNDETSRLCTWHVPAAHWLESWSDGRAWDGTASVAQPLIDPLFGGKTAAELVSMLAGTATPAYELVRAWFRKKFGTGADIETKWEQALNDGVIAGSAATAGAGTLKNLDWSLVSAAAEQAKKAADAGVEIVFAQDRKVYDGRFANNAWLQELPDPITKMTWDNAALIAPADAARWGVRRDDKIEITLGGRTLTLPVCEVPGHAPGSITLPLGYGRGSPAGAVAEGSGFDTYVLRTKAGFHVAGGATVRSVGESYRLATTQDHHAMRSQVGTDEIQARVPKEIVRETTVKGFAANPDFAKPSHVLPLVQLFGSHQSDAVPRWGMSIDLSKCTGCSACVVACQAENNIPVVGKVEVQLGREMHWLRIDRYFRGEPTSPDVRVVHQPVPCQQCENAPCEQVCPVAATVHDEQGLNVMVYNRCIGTRYCSNNCPYKVRRFNWFFNHHGPQHPRSLKTGTIEPLNPFKPALLPQQYLIELEKLGNNPDVTVRSRGVMEKCTFCVQRLSAARLDARNAQVSPVLGERSDGEIPDGAVQTACAQACPAEAITFGDLRSAETAVSKKHADRRSYFLLEELGVRPRVKYMGKIRNPLHDVAASGGHGDHAPAKDAKESKDAHAAPAGHG